MRLQLNSCFLLIIWALALLFGLFLTICVDNYTKNYYETLPKTEAKIVKEESKLPICSCDEFLTLVYGLGLNVNDFEGSIGSLNKKCKVSFAANVTSFNHFVESLKNFLVMRSSVR